MGNQKAAPAFLETAQGRQYFLRGNRPVLFPQGAEESGQQDAALLFHQPFFPPGVVVVRQRKQIGQGSAGASFGIGGTVNHPVNAGVKDVYKRQLLVP